MNFDYKIEEQTEVNVITLSGQLIESHQGELLIDDVENLIIKDSINLELDLSEMTFINHIGTDILISLLTKARIAGGECTISKISNELKSSDEYKRIAEIFSLSINELIPVELLK